MSSINDLAPAEARARFLACCGSRRWAEAMAVRRPYLSLMNMAQQAEQVWTSLAPEDWLEAFAAHPRIGDRSAQGVAASEQAGVREAAEETLQELARLNREYEARFGYIFIVRAAGRPAEEVLALLGRRLRNDSDAELREAAAEQLAITELRLKTLWTTIMITTHVLDTVQGAPAARLPVELDFFITGHGWREVGHGLTNDEGRILEFGEPAAAGVYRLMFDVAAYTPRCFFPSVTVTFEVRDPNQRYHIPLLLSAYGYTTYRGS